MKHYPIDANELIAESLERNLVWAGKLLTGQAMLWIRVYPYGDAEEAYDRPVTVQELEVFGKHAESVVVHATTGGEMPRFDTIESGEATWLGDIVDGKVASGSLLAELCPNLK